MFTDENNNTQSKSVECSDFGIETDDGVVGLVPYGFNTSSDESVEIPIRSKIRKRRVQTQSSTWFAAKNKKLRQSGNKYAEKKKIGDVWQYNIQKSARKIKKRCNCVQIAKAPILQCWKISEECRQGIFKEFWELSWPQKEIYAKTLVHSIAPKRPRNRKIDIESKRSQSLQYHLRVDNQSLRVCRTLFLNTLCIGRNTVQNWTKKPLNQGTMKTKLPQYSDRQYLYAFFDSLPITESHYCRANTSKKYLLNEWQSKAKLYEFYVNDWCKEPDKNPLSITIFNEVFAIKNLALFRPKKDQCEICSCYLVGNVPSENYVLHQQKKK